MAEEKRQQRDLTNLSDDFTRRTPTAQWEIVTVTFPDTPDTDLVIPHKLEPPTPEYIDYWVVKTSGPPLVYHDNASGRKSWGKGFVILRSAIGGLKADILLTVSALRKDLRQRFDGGGKAIPVTALSGTDVFIRKIETHEPDDLGDQPIRQLTTGSTAVSGTSETLRRATWSFFDTKTDDNDNAMIMVDVRHTTNPGGTIKKTGIHIKSFNMPDNGGDSSGMLVVQTGAGNGISAYRYPNLRPGGFTDYTNQDPGGYAIEGATGATWYAMGAFATVGNSGCFTANIAHSAAKGIIVNPADATFDSRIAYAVGSPQVNAADINIKWRVLCDGGMDIFSTRAPLFRMEQTGTGNAEFRLARTAGTTKEWIIYVPSGSTDIRYFDGSDKFVFRDPGHFLMAGGLGLGSVSTTVESGGAYFPEVTDRSAPAGNTAVLYAKDNGAGKTQLVVRFNTGAVQVIATEP